MRRNRIRAAREVKAGSRFGLAVRLAGRDELARRRRRQTRWVPCPERNRDPRHFEKMF